MFTHDVLKCCIGGGVRVFWYLGACLAGLVIVFVLCTTWQQQHCIFSSSGLFCILPNATFPILALLQRLNVYKLNFVWLRTTGSASIRASPQVHPGLCPALPPLNTFVSPSAPWWRFTSGTTPPSIRHLPFSSCLCISTGRSSGAQELRSYLLPPPPLGPDCGNTLMEAAAALITFNVFFKPWIFFYFNFECFF